MFYTLDLDVILAIHIVAGCLILFGIFLTLGGLCKRYRSKSLEIVASVTIIVASMGFDFILIKLHFNVSCVSYLNPKPAAYF